MENTVETLQDQLLIAKNSNSHATLVKDLDKARKQVKLRDKEIQGF